MSVTDDDISVAFYSNKTDSKEASFQDNPTFKLFRAQIRFSNIIHASQVKLQFGKPGVTFWTPFIYEYTKGCALVLVM